MRVYSRQIPTPRQVPIARATPPTRPCRCPALVVPALASANRSAAGRTADDHPELLRLIDLPGFGYIRRRLLAPAGWIAELVFFDYTTVRDLQRAIDVALVDIRRSGSNRVRALPLR